MAAGISWLNATEAGAVVILTPSRHRRVERSVMPGERMRPCTPLTAIEREGLRVDIELGEQCRAVPAVNSDVKSPEDGADFSPETPLVRAPVW